MHKSYLTGRCCPCWWEWSPSPRPQLATGSEISNLPRSGSWASEAQACYLGGGQPWGCWAARRLCVWHGQVGHSHVQCRIFCRKHYVLCRRYNASQRISTVFLKGQSNLQQTAMLYLKVAKICRKSLVWQSKLTILVLNSGPPLQKKAVPLVPAPQSIHDWKPLQQMEMCSFS